MGYGLPIQTLFQALSLGVDDARAVRADVPDAQTRFIEPLWKALLSCKGILAILWELYPDHPNLLPAFFDAHGMTSYVRKPLYSREGANVEVVVDGTITHAGEGRYGEEGYVYQALYNMPEFFRTISGDRIVDCGQRSDRYVYPRRRCIGDDQYE